MKERRISKSSRKKQTQEKPINTLPLYIFLIIVLALYIYFQSAQFLSIVFGALLFFLIILLLVLETINGVKEEGYVKNIIEIVAALLIVVVFWYGLKYILQTNYPLDVVPSCSMLPNLQRGDLVVLQGVKNIKALKAPIINVANNTFNNFIGNISQEALSCVAYNQTTGKISQFVSPGYVVGLYTGGNGGSIVSPSAQNGSLVKYTCGTTNVRYKNGTVKQEAYTTSVKIAGTTFSGDKNNSVIVYQTVPQDFFYREGDLYIVHRVYAIINVSGTYYALTKGDNNPGLDLQYNNVPPSLDFVQGKVISDIPYVGYLKLILSSNFNQPYGCDFTTIQ